MDEAEYWTTTEAAEAWGVSHQRVRALCRVKGKIQGLKESVNGYKIPVGTENPARKTAGRPKKQ